MTALILVDDAPLAVRPVDLVDVADLARMFERCSPESIYFRFFSPLPQVPTALLCRLADVDHCRSDALVALHDGEIVAMASYDAGPDGEPGEAEIAVVVADAWHRRGIGLRLTRDLAELARDRGYRTFFARALPNNRAALGLIRKLAPDATARFAGGEYEVRVALDDVTRTADGLVRKEIDCVAATF